MHVGVHKTATTHLQLSIGRQRAALLERGVSFQGPAQLREGAVLKRLQKDPAQSAGHLQEMLQGAPRLAISEENFMGSLQGPRGKLRLYPHAAGKLAHLATCVAPAPLHVLIALRCPSTYINSAYGQLLMGGGLVPLDGYLKKNPFQAVDWVGLVKRILSVPQVASLTVWRYEDYGAVFGQVCASFLGAEAAAAVAPNPGHAHTGLSVRAALGIAQQEGSVAEMRDAFPVGERWPPIDAFDADDHALAAEFYATQIAEIAVLDRVNLLRPRKA